MGRHSRTNSADPCAILEELVRLVKGYTECTVANPPIPPKPTGSRRIDGIANDVFYLAMRAFVAESRAPAVLTTQESPPTPQSAPIGGGATDTDTVQQTRKKLRVEIPPNYLSNLLLPATSPLPTTDDFKDLPNAVRGIHDSLDVCASEIRQLRSRLDPKEEVQNRSPAQESKSPDIRMRGQSLQARNDVLARQAERIRSACGLLLEGQFDDASWRGVFDESSSLSHPLSRLRIGLASFTSQIISALKTFHKNGVWTKVAADGLGSTFREVCDRLNDLMGYAKVRYVQPGKPLARAQTVPAGTRISPAARPPLRPKPSRLRSPLKGLSFQEGSKQEY
ncbi:hypothetical protein FRC05_010813 [Tulasnella sp. 425]|nr:hypothetical protein FRC05_010813 [Tulasnella sp. 425]